MASTVLYMSMSLDGFIAGPNESVDNGLGDGGDRLHEWGLIRTESGEYIPRDLSGSFRDVMDEFNATGAVVCGRGTIDPAGGWDGDHHNGVPIFVYARQLPGPEDLRWPHVTYVSEIEEAMALAKEAASEKNVLVHGAGTAQAALAAGVLDEVQIHLIPVLLGTGRRLFEHLGTGHIELEPVRILEGTGVTHLRYRVCK